MQNFVISVRKFTCDVLIVELTRKWRGFKESIFRMRAI